MDDGYKRCYWCGYTVNNVLRYDNQFAHHPKCPIRHLLKMDSDKIAYKPGSPELKKLDRLGVMPER